MTVILASQSDATPVTQQAVTSPAPIPFRKTSIVSGSEVFGVLLTTLLFLAAVAALAWFARRQGWLDRWTGGTAAARDAGRSLAVIEVLRISRKTTLYRVSNGKREFLLAESNAHIQLAPAQREQEVSP
jgi:hypothetical protein